MLIFPKIIFKYQEDDAQGDTVILKVNVGRTWATFRLDLRDSNTYI